MVLECGRTGQLIGVPISSMRSHQGRVDMETCPASAIRLLQQRDEPLMKPVTASIASSSQGSRLYADKLFGYQEGNKVKKM
eukprot:8191669-Karenia_brevis.AAC.1